MALAALILMNLLYLSSIIMVKLSTMFLFVKEDAFMAQIQKLVMANKIDRAIKLCNVEEQALVAINSKRLLTRANRSPEEIDDEKDVALTQLDEFIAERDKMAWYITAAANVTTLIFLLFLVAAGAYGTWHIILGVTGYLLSGFLVYAASAVAMKAKKVKTKILELRNWLVARQRGGMARRV